MRIAVTGKGGAGKTAFVATLCQVLARSGARVLAFDFDVNPGLDVSLGALDRHPRLPVDAVTPQDHAQYGFALRAGLSPAEAVERYAARSEDGVRLLSLGRIGSARHDLARTHMAVRQVAAGFDEPGWDVLVDMEAGTKDVYDGSYVPFVDVIVMVTDGSAIADLVCRRLTAIARGQDGPDVALLLNKADEVRVARARELAAELQVPFVGAVPLDDAVRRADVAGVPLVDHAPRCPAVTAVAELADTLRLHCEGVRLGRESAASR